MVEAIAATLGEHLTTVHAIDLADTFNTVLVATRQETQAANLRVNAAQMNQPFVNQVAARSLAGLHHLQGNGRVFTDDRAPVESLTNAIILRYLIFGE
jgi:hypothetical protein